MDIISALEKGLCGSVLIIGSFIREERCDSLKISEFLFNLVSPADVLQGIS